MCCANCLSFTTSLIYGLKYFRKFVKLSKLQASSNHYIICKLKQDLIFSGICLEMTKSQLGGNFSYKLKGRLTSGKTLNCFSNIVSELCAANAMATWTDYVHDEMDEDIFEEDENIGHLVTIRKLHLIQMNPDLLNLPKHNHTKDWMNPQVNF